MKKYGNEPLTGELLDEDMLLALEALCHLCQASPDLVVEMVDYGLLVPQGRVMAEWRFTGPAVTRIKRVLRLQHDLEVNLPGAIVIVEMLDELEQLRRKLHQFE